MTVLLLSDLHLTTGGKRIIGLDPKARFNAVLETALTRHRDIERIVILGDLAHRGEAECYAWLARALEDMPCPVSLILGNHDRRGPFGSVFPGHLNDAGFAQDVVDTGGFRLILCDTLDEAAPDRHSGLMCETRMAWLEAALAASAGRETIVLTHHPLFATGFDGMDAIGLRNAGAVADLLRCHGTSLVVSGHVHRNIWGVAGTLPWCVLPSTCHQMPLVLGEAGSDLSVDSPGGYGLLSRTDSVVLHVGDTTAPRVDRDPDSR